MNKLDYPILSGRVLSVPAVIEENGQFVTVIDYIPTGDEMSEDEMKKVMPGGILSAFVEEHKEKANQTLQERVKRAFIPLRIDPSVIDGAEFRTILGQINEGDYGEGFIAKTYELLIIKGKSRAGGDIFSGLAEHIDGPPHSGMRYIKVLKEE
ncbi:hypothetical protein GOV12_03690 [Candidatus Pacearchaeota archaeon]|nr:hypothetical protein [Candidatus Pacearchaeota archaeon]